QQYEPLRLSDHERRPSGAANSPASASRPEIGALVGLADESGNLARSGSPGAGSLAGPRRRARRRPEGAAGRVDRFLRKRTGIEPAGPALTGGPTGFEDRAGHQPRTRFQEGLSQIAT